MGAMHYVEFLLRVEHICSSIIRRCYPTSWNEDHITYSLTDELAQLQYVEVLGLDRPFKITWDARKLRGAPEQQFGDIGIVVRLKSWSGEEINGVGLLEAKRRDANSANFGAMRKRQLKTILRHTPSSRLLLYDYSQITGFGDNLVPPEIWQGAYQRPWLPIYQGPLPAIAPCSHCLTVPTGIALSTGIYTTGLYKYGVPFSVQLCGRYLRGLDIEYRESTVSKVSQFINRSGGPRHLLLAGVSTGDGDPTPPDWISDKYYEPLRLNAPMRDADNRQR